MILKNKYRTHNCAELRLTDSGKNVILSGWVNSIRRLGGVTFVTLRDHYGITQLLFKNENMLLGVNPETVICVVGKVLERTNKNPKMQTGDIEIAVDKLTILGESKNILPFEIIDSQNTKEELRLKYRYLDLRNSQNHDMIVKRSKLMQDVRNIFHKLDFTEIQTPILTSSSPEGARDFLVPSRLNAGKFYALPQSPQQFKQLLMISGFDKYFQLAPCFRDEDARADRAPGEFYQVDFEMSFVNQDDVFKTMETVLTKLIKTNSAKIMTPAPFERISYKNAMDKYCTDKPDLRNPLICYDLTAVFKDTQFNAFKGKTIKALSAHTIGQPRSFYDAMTKYIIDIEGKGLSYIKVDDQLNGSIVKFLSEKEIAGMLSILKPVKGDAIFLIADEFSMATKLTGAFRNKLGRELGLIDENKLHFCWIVDFPFYEYNQEAQKIEFGHNPFSMPQGGLDSLNNLKPLDILAHQYDIVLNGYELGSGAIRNHNPHIMERAFEIAGYDNSVVKNKFPALYNAFEFGAPPHAGAAFGFDRLLMILNDCEIIRDVIAFPLNKNAQDLLMGAPNSVEEKQLKDAHIKLDLKNK